MMASTPAYNDYAEHVLMPAMDQEKLAEVKALEAAGNTDDPRYMHLTTATLAGVRGIASSAAEHQARALSDQLIAELRAADTIVIGAPMYNFSVPTGLRAWFDHILRAGETFSYSEAGPQGLIEGRRAIVVESRGGLYSEGPAQAADFQEPYLRFLLGFIGITDVTFIHAEKIGYRRPSIRPRRRLHPRPPPSAV